MTIRLLVGLLVAGGAAVAEPVFREDFKEVPAHIPVVAGDLTCEFLDLELLGPGAATVKLSYHPEIENDPHYLWNGQCEGPVLIAFPFAHDLDLSDKGSVVRLRSKNWGESSLHLAFRVGEQWFMKKDGLSKDKDWTEHAVMVHPGEWRKLDPKTVTSTPSLIPDLRKVNAIGFVAPVDSDKSKDCIRLDWFELESGSAEVAGFVPMFNGKDLSGWQTTGNWVVEEGAVTLKPRPGESGWKRYDAYLTTEREYGDFVLDLEFKFEKKGNSGVFMRVGDLKDHVESGFEVQILDTHGKEKVGHHDCGGVIRTAAPSKNMVKPAGEWNRYTITLKGSSLKVVLNGEQIIDLDLSESAMKDRPMKGYISFQDEAKRVWYRNVRIRELE